MNDNHYYSSARNTQIVLYLLKANNIRKVIASPGTQNMSLVVSMQRDPYFEMYSAADERSAAYMACGLAAELGETVVISCTGATASRNYLPGLTEAFYRHLPVVAITSTERENKIGHGIAQIIDRRAIPNDVAKISVTANAVDTPDDAWNCMIQVNKALQEIHHHGTGPIHINLEKTDDMDFSITEIPPCRVIRRITPQGMFPKLTEGKIGIFVGSHLNWSNSSIQAVDNFCAAHNAVVFCDHTSNFKGEYRVFAPLIASQEWNESAIFNLDLLIQVGEISGEYYEVGKLTNHVKEVWRVNEDGEIRDNLKKLTNIFEMDEITFFSYYTPRTFEKQRGFYDECWKEYYEIYEMIPQSLPLCNIWMAQHMAPELPENSIVHFGILNSLRSWNFFEIPKSVQTFSNVGGFGIDGGLSTLLGASLAHPDKIHFGIIGDLAFFYDMNSLGNRHLGNNVRIMLVNNAKGCEFKLYSHPASRLGEEGDEFIAAARHYGNKSLQLVRHYAEDLGFEYLTACTKEEFLHVYKHFLSPVDLGHPVLLEVFTNAEDQSDTLKTINSLKLSKVNQNKDKVKKIIGADNAHAIQRVINKLKGK